MFEIRDGKAVTPGGQRSVAAWTELAGASPDKGVEFFDKLVTRDDGWLTLVGLFWLEEGENKFGTNKENPVVLPRYKTAPVAGSLWLENGYVRIETRPGVEITADGNPVTTLDLKADIDDGGPTILKLGSLIINIVKRGDRVGVRVKD